MDDQVNIDRAPVTPEFVLSVLNDWHRQTWLAEFENEQPELLTWESTIEDWRFDDDFPSWRRVARGMNQVWGVSIPLQEWKAVLSPVGKKKLDGVCQLIAQHTQVPVVRERIFFGKPCRPASVFLTIRGLLQEAGVDVSEILPSTSLDEYARWHIELFWHKCAMLAPGAMPACRFVKTPWQEMEGVLFQIGTGLFLLGWIAGMIDPLVLIIPLILMLLLLVYSFVRCCLPEPEPSYVYFGELKTFRDLSEAIAVHEGARIS